MQVHQNIPFPVSKHLFRSYGTISRSGPAMQPCLKIGVASPCKSSEWQFDNTRRLCGAMTFRQHHILNGPSADHSHTSAPERHPSPNVLIDHSQKHRRLGGAALSFKHDDCTAWAGSLPCNPAVGVSDLNWVKSTDCFSFRAQSCLPRKPAFSSSSGNGHGVSPKL